MQWFVVSGQDYACACTHNGVLHNKQQLQCAGRAWFRFSWRHWVLVDLRDEIRGSFMLKPQWVLDLSYCCWTKKKERITKITLSLLHTFAYNCLPQGSWTTLWVLLIIKALKEEGWVLNTLLAYFVVMLYGFCLSIAYIAHLCHPYIWLSGNHEWKAQDDLLRISRYVSSCKTVTDLQLKVMEYLRLCPAFSWKFSYWKSLLCFCFGTCNLTVQYPYLVWNL